ncbi:hypothetical protein CAEBREN_15218 [Caenorhabditis brenneri]|uniref:Uncharacterized protein n=1 Tax=Caenorhabditis brenneri TaxID=135651 RepID=G0NW78_CAEBE|nr:hypothetical protein CAEBREN_15218 [Caenorhabditis brenneri]
MAMMKITFHLATYSMKSSKNQESKVNILQIDFESKTRIEYVGGYVSDPESEESEQEEEDEEKLPDFENYAAADEANEEMLEFSDDEEKIEENDGMNSFENTKNTFEWDEAIACIPLIF